MGGIDLYKPPGVFSILVSDHCQSRSISGLLAFSPNHLLYITRVSTANVYSANTSKRKPASLDHTHFRLYILARTFHWHNHWCGLMPQWKKENPKQNSVNLLLENWRNWNWKQNVFLEILTFIETLLSFSLFLLDWFYYVYTLLYFQGERVQLWCDLKYLKSKSKRHIFFFSWLKKKKKTAVFKFSVWCFGLCFCDCILHTFNCLMHGLFKKAQHTIPYSNTYYRDVPSSFSLLRRLTVTECVSLTVLSFLLCKCTVCEKNKDKIDRNNNVVMTSHCSPGSFRWSSWWFSGRFVFAVHVSWSGKWTEH